MLLTDTAKATTKPFKLRDGEGMYLLIMPNGSKYFRLDYRLNGKRQTLALGVYPKTSLDAARANRDNAKKQIKDGIKPKLSTVNKTVSTKTNTVNSFDFEGALKSFTTDSINPDIANERLKQEKMADENIKLAMSGIETLVTKEEPQKKQSDTVIDLERQLQVEGQRNDNLNGKLAALMGFSHLTKEQQDMLSVPDNPAMAKLKELSQLSVDQGIGGFEDAELVKELERRGFEVSIYKETPK
jgi:Arm DNA-binding domain